MLIGLAGPARCGKDTVADFIMLSKYPFYRTAFAWALKEMLMQGLGLKYDQVDGDQKDIIDPFYECTPRHMMQTLGTEWGRDLINPDIWLLVVKRKVEKALNAVITDVRFDNEAEFIRKNNGVVVHIVREVEKINDHASEAGVLFKDKYDRIIYNLHDKKNLQFQVNELLDDLDLTELGENG